MRILHICSNFVPRERARNGGELRYWQNLTSLVSLGHDIYLVLCNVKEDLDLKIERLAKKVFYINKNLSANNRTQLWQSLFSDKCALELYIRQSSDLYENIFRITQDIQPDLILADWIGAMMLVPDGVPVLYSHHDFHYKIISVRMETQGKQIRLIDRLRIARLRREELRLCSKASHIICVSDSERKELEKISTPSTYIPIVESTIPRPSKLATEKGRVFMFGNWENTAMRFSAKHLRTKIWPLFEEIPPSVEWHQVGEPAWQESENWKWIQKHFVCHGFVMDLSEIFRIGDASFIPYQRDTGFRTKFVTACGYGLVNIGYEKTFLCAPEFIPGQNCITGKSPDELADAIYWYSKNEKVRKNLGESSRLLYEQKFSFESQLPKYEKVLLDMFTNRRDKKKSLFDK